MSTNESLIDQLIREKRDRPAVDVIGTVKDWYQKNIGAPLPLSNVGATNFHKSLRLEHSRAFDIGLDPRTREGQRLIGFLDSQGIPYLAFDRAIAGTSTGPHIHVGPPSQRGVSLVDRLLQEKEQFGEAPQRPLTAAERRSEYGSRAHLATHPEKNPAYVSKLQKLAHDINWHFGYSVLMAMPTLSVEKQREVIDLATRYAQEDEAKKKKGAQISESQLWKYRNQDLVGIREGKEIEVRQPPDVAAEMSAQWRSSQNPLMRLPNSVRRFAEPLISGAGGLIEFGAGVGRLAEKAGSPGAKVGREFLEKHGKQAREMAVESQVFSERRKGTRIAQGVGSGLIEFAPLFLAPELGLESALARIGALSLMGGAYTGTQAVGRGGTAKEVTREAAVGGASFGLMGIPLPGKTWITRSLSNLVIVGGGTAIINRATGQPLEDAMIHGLVQFGLNVPAAFKKVKVQEADGTERPATERDIKGLLPAARFEMETVDSPLPSTLTTKAKGAGRVFTETPGQQELFSGIAKPVDRAVGRADLPGEFPPVYTFEEFALSRGIDLTNPQNLPMKQIDIRLEPLYNAYRESVARGGGRGVGTVTETTPSRTVLDYGTFLHGFFGWVQGQGVDPVRLAQFPELLKKAADHYTTNVAGNGDTVRTLAATYSFEPTQMIFPLPGPLGESRAAFGGGRREAPEVAAGDVTLREVASLSPEQQQYRLAELIQQRRKPKNLSVQELAKIDRQIAYLEQVVESLPAGPEKGVVRLSEQTARSNLETLKALRDDKPTWNALNKKQKEAIETQIKRYEEQSVGEIQRVEEPKVGDRGRLRYTTREQLDPNKARLMQREQTTPETNVPRETSSTGNPELDRAIQKWKQERAAPESEDQRIKRLVEEHRTDNFKEFIKSEKGSGPDLEALRFMFTKKQRDVKELGSVERKRNVRPEALRGADQFVREQRAEQEYFENLVRVLEAERPKSDIIDLTDKPVDIRTKLRDFLADETGSLDVEKVRKGLSKIYEYVREGSRTLGFTFKAGPRREPIHIEVTIDKDGTAHPNFGRLTSNPIGTGPYVGGRKLKIGLSMVLALKRVFLENYPEIKRIEFMRVGSTSDKFEYGRERALEVKQKAKDFLKDEEGSFDPEELARRIRELLKKNPKLTDAEIKIALRGGSVEYRNVGVDPREAVRLADNLNRAGVKIERGELQDFSVRDWIRKSPLSNLDFKGYFERIGGESGKKVSDTFRNAQVKVEELGVKWEHEIGTIVEFLEKARKEKATPKKEFYSQFVDLVEKPFGDPLRRPSDPNVRQALEKHDQLTSTFKEYIKETRAQLGVDMPADWGITERGYYRHLFLGDIQMFVIKDGKQNFIGTARTYGEAQKKALELRKADPSVEVEAQPRTNFYQDPTTRLSSKKFWHMVSNLTRSVRGRGGRLTIEDFLEDARGIVGQRKNQQKFFGPLLHREGYGGYLKDYARVMEIHAQQLARTQELTKLNRELQPLIEKLKTEGKPGLAEDAQNLLDTLWGKPSKFELAFGNEIRKIPILRNHVANPDSAFRNLASRLTQAQRILRLDFNARASIVNALDPWSTLWPYVSTREFVGLYAKYLQPATRQMLRERGVSQGATKLEAGVPVRGKKYKVPRPFHLASEMNRGIGYLYGLKDGTRKGLEGDALHRYGLEWAKKVEFDNSLWNVAPVLRSPGARILGQFKGYPLKQIEHIGTLARKQEGETARQPLKRVGKFVGAKVAAGGVKAALSPVRLVAGYFGYEVVSALSSQLQQYGMEKDDADKAAQAVYYGTPALIGQDLSASVAVMDDFYGTTPEEKVVNLLGGPTVGTMFRVSKAKDWKQFASRVSPLGRLAKAGEAYESGGKLVVPGPRGEEIELTPFESTMYLLGFTPAKQTQSYEADTAQREQYKESNEKVIKDLAREFNKKLGIKSPIIISEGEYEDLTNSLESGGDLEELKQLLETKSRSQVTDYYSERVNKPFTRSNDREIEFKKSLTSEQTQLYNDLKAKRRQQANKVRELLDKLPATR